MKLNKNLENDTVLIKDLELSQLRILNDAEVPWIILVPRVLDCNEFTDLSFSDQTILLEEINYVSSIIKANYPVDKLNIASIGNIVSQLHIHIIGRYKNDRAWPGTIWGTKTSSTLSQNDIMKCKNAFSC